MPEQLREFITPESITTFGGASMVVWVLSNAVRTLTNHSSKWIVFVVSTLVSFAITYINNRQISNNLYVIFLGEPLNTMFSIINACLLFLNSLGLQTTLTNPPPRSEQHGEKKRKVRWFDPW